MGAPKGNKFAKFNNGGAPTKYDPKYCKEIIEFFSIPPHNGSKNKHFLMPNTLPTLLRFSMKIGVSKKNLLEWADRHDEFRVALDTAKELYKEFLSANGLLGLYNANFAKFIAINTTDMKEKVEVSGNFGFSRDELEEDYKQ